MIELKSDEIQKAVKKVCKKLALIEVEKSKKKLLRQHLICKLTGDCHPMLDFMVDYVSRKR